MVHGAHDPMIGSRESPVPLNYWCWNIQRINPAKVHAFADEIRGLVAQQRQIRRATVGPAGSFRANPDLAEIGIILENQTNPEDVCAALEIAFNAKASGGGDLFGPYRFTHRRIGGVAGTNENLIIAYRNCAAPQFLMRPLSDLVLAGMVQDLAGEQELPTRLSLRHRGYGAGTVLGDGDIADIAADEAQQFFDHLLRDSNWYRGLALLRVAAGGRSYVIGTVHLPGPSAHAHYSQGVNRRIVTEFVIPCMLQGEMVDVVMGDFNIYGPVTQGNIIDLTSERIRSGTTIAETLDWTTGFMSRNQFDKCLVNGLKVDVNGLDAGALALIAPGPISIRIRSFREVTDHAGLFLFLP
jgi:hypothetical protein